MQLQDLLTEQILAFHDAIMDSCRRALRPEHSDRMALGLRGNAVSMAKLQLAMAALAPTEAPVPAPDPAIPEHPVARQPGSASPALEPPWAEPPLPDPPPMTGTIDPADHVLTGDALSRFASRRLGPDESAHAAWQLALAAGDDATQRYPARASDRGRRDVNARPP